MDNSERKSHLLFAALLTLLLALPVLALLAEPAHSTPERNLSQDSHNIWRAGLADGAFLFNQHLRNYQIRTRIDNDTAHLTGAVSSPEERALAEQIALSVEGVTQVINDLQVNPHYPTEPAHARAAAFTDTAVTTKVKSQLLANSETSGLKIDVKTDDSIVTLTGEVTNDVEKELAYYITRNTGGVRHVINKIAIEPKA